MASETPCSVDGCTSKSRARGMCDTHYRRVLHDPSNGGRPPTDRGYVYKVRVRNERGSQPYYYSIEEKALTMVAQARAAGTLEFFARYRFEEEL